MRCEIHDVHLWRARTQELAADAGELAATLSPDEQQRAQGFALRKDREAFILRRGLLRAILSQYLPEGPDEIRFRHGYFGKPHLDLGSHRPGLYFNLSHRMGLVLCALGRGGPLGVDVEFLAPMRDVDGMAAQFLPGHESAAIAALPPAERLLAFYIRWTRQEAYLKAKGDGSTQAPDPIPPSAGQVETIWPAPGYVGALASEAGIGQISWRDWPADRAEPAPALRQGRSADSRPTREDVCSGS